MPQQVPGSKIKSAREKRRTQDKKKNLIGWGIAALIVLSVVVFMLTRPAPQPLSAARMKTDPTLGAQTAKVTITEFSDFG